MRKSTIGLIRSLRKLLLKISLPVNMFEEFFQGKLTLEILFFFIFFRDDLSKTYFIIL